MRLLVLVWISTEILIPRICPRFVVLIRLIRLLQSPERASQTAGLGITLAHFVIRLMLLWVSALGAKALDFDIDAV